MLLVVFYQVMPQDVLVLESGELTELGRSYVRPRVLLDALHAICASASQWGDPNESENLAMEIVIVAHHPSLGTRRACYILHSCPFGNCLAFYTFHMFYILSILYVSF